MKLLDVIACCAVGLLLATVARATAGQGDAADDVTIGPPLPPGANEGVWIENRGQWPNSIRFLGQVRGQIVRLECGAIGLQINDGEPRYVRIAFDEASPSSTPLGEDPVQAQFSFFLTQDASKWRPCVPGYRRVRSPEFLPGLDLICDMDTSGLRVRLISAHGHEPIDPEVLVEGRLGEAGAAAPQRLPLSSALSMLAGSSGSTVQSIPSTISAGGGPNAAQLTSVPGPGLRWATYLGSSDPQGSGSYARRCAWNDVGELVVTGGASPIGFPQTPGVYHGPTSGHQAAYVAKFRGRDGALTYSCLLGNASLGEVVLDHSGSATVIGGTQDATFPTTPGSFQPTLNHPGTYQGVITRLTPSADALVFSTFLEVQGPQCGLLGIGLHPLGGVIVGGWAQGISFPTTPGAFQTAFTASMENAFVGWLDASGSFFHWLTLFGGTNGFSFPYTPVPTRLSGLVVTSSGEPIILGTTGCNDLPTTPGVFQPALAVKEVIWAPYVARFNASGSGLMWSTYLTGTTPSEWDETANIAIDAFENVFVSGSTTDAVPTFPVTPGAFQTHYPHYNGSPIHNGFLAKLDSSAHNLLYSTLITGRLGGFSGFVSVDGSGTVTCSGGASDFPWTPGSYNSAPLQNNIDFAVTRLSPAGNRLLYATHVGGPLLDGGYARLGQNGSVALCGYSRGGFPTTPGSVQPNYSMGQTNSVIAVFDPYLLGVQPLGGSTPSCLGNVQMNTTEMPAAGSQTFALWCSGAPPSASGKLLMGARRQTPQNFGGAEIWVDLTQPHASLPVTSDGVGYLETALPLPASSAGRQVVAQYVFRNPPTCTTGHFACASQALTIVVQ